MEIVEIIPPYLYSVKYDDEQLDEYHRMFRDWHEVGYLAEFFRLNADYLQQPFWKDISQNRKMQQKMSLSMLQPWNDISISLPRMQIMVKRQTLSPTFIPWMVSMSMSGD